MWLILETGPVKTWPSENEDNSTGLNAISLALHKKRKFGSIDRSQACTFLRWGQSEEAVRGGHLEAKERPETDTSHRIIRGNPPCWDPDLGLPVSKSLRK